MIFLFICFNFSIDQIGTILKCDDIDWISLRFINSYTIVWVCVDFSIWFFSLSRFCVTFDFCSMKIWIHCFFFSIVVVHFNDVLLFYQIKVGLAKQINNKSGHFFYMCVLFFFHWVYYNNIEKYFLCYDLCRIAATFNLCVYR